MAHTQGGHRGQDIDNDYGRFGRMFPGERGPIFDRAALALLGRSMVKDDVGKPFNEGDSDENEGLPAAYTYFGQFVDHDLTLDLTGLGEQEADSTAIENFRSSRLDLDSVYGHGLGNSRYLYDPETFKFEISGRLIAPDKKGSVQSKRDLFRSPVGTALIGDHRNDENVIVAQIQQAFTRFHNRVMDDNRIIDASVTGYERFRRTVRTVRHHYQWVVLRDFLKRVCDPVVYAALVPKDMGEAPKLKHYTDAMGLAEWPFMPIEFSGAGYRFGHSMVRPSYALNAEAGTGPAVNPAKTRIPFFDVTPNMPDLRGFKPMQKGLGIDWGYLLELPGTAPAGFGGGQLWQPAYRIDTLLVDPLAQLPDHMDRSDPNERSLAFLNLLRGSMLQLPTAEMVADRLGIAVLDPKDIWSYGSRHMTPAKADADGKKLITKRKELGLEFSGSTPLWYYILREAEFGSVSGNGDIFGGRHLGPMGSTIVLETFLALLWLDRSSVLHIPGWRPHAAIKGGGSADAFELKDLLRYALG